MIKLPSFLGVQSDSSNIEKIVALVGGCLSILCIAFVSFKTTGLMGTAAIVPSMGAATVLLFAVPHGPLSQPWALFVGNVISAVVGVSCAKFIANPILASGLAVGLAIGAMHWLRCIHPPGGATALAAVIGGSQIHELGYFYVVMPTLLNCMIIFAFAVIFNGLFPWRRYPAAFMKFEFDMGSAPSNSVKLIDVEAALKDMPSPVDINPEQLLVLVNKAFSHSQQADQKNTKALCIELGGVYSNNRPGSHWSVRKIVDEQCSENSVRDMVIYTRVDGQGLNSSGSCTRQEFENWAKARLKPKHR